MAFSQGQPTPKGAVAYDRELVPWLFDRWAEPFIDLADPAPSDAVLDLACGSGLIVRHLIDRLNEHGRVCGADLDPGMLSYAAASIDDPRVSWHESDAARLPFESDSFDVLYCHQGLQFFPDRNAVLGEVRRVLRPQGRLAIAVWGRLVDNPWPAALADAVRAVVGSSAGDSMSVVCALGDPGDLAAVLRAAHFDEATIDVHAATANHPDVAKAVAGQLSALPAGTAIADLDPAQLTELADTMCQLLEDHTAPTGQLSVPSTCVLATATNK